MLSKIIAQMLAMFLVIIIFLVILSSDAFAFQVSPAKITQTEPVQTHNFLVRVDSPGLVEVGFEGELAQYASANTTYVESEARIPVTVSLPELTPGKHDLLVVFQKAISSGEVGANAQIAPRIRYVEEFEGVYIESVASVRENTRPLEIVTIHENFGTQAGNTSIILQLEDILIEDELYVEELERKDYTIDYQKGEYQLRTILSNGTELTEQSRTVEIGTPTITLEELNVTMGNVAVLDLAFDSDWNVPHEEELITTINGEELELVTVSIPGTTQVFWENPQEGNATVIFTIGEQEITRELQFDEQQLLPKTLREAAPLLLILLITLALLGIALLFKNKERFK